MKASKELPIEKRNELWGMYRRHKVYKRYKFETFVKYRDYFKFYQTHLWMHTLKDVYKKFIDGNVVWKEYKYEGNTIREYAA